MKKRRFDSEARVVDFTCHMMDEVKKSPDPRAGNYIAGQLIISGHPPTFNCGEVQGAEFRNDFTRKIGKHIEGIKTMQNDVEDHPEKNDKTSLKSG